MLLFIVICIVFLLMLIAPIYVGIQVSRKKDEPLFIQKSDTRNPRYFAISFRNIINKALESYDGSGILKMSKDEEVIETDKVELPYMNTCKSLVYAENKDFTPVDDIVFEKEIYVKKNARLEKIPVIRAIACLGDLILGNGISVVRWADAEGTVTVYDNCSLGISTTSASRLLIGRNCSFKRLYAPEIMLGLDYEDNYREQIDHKKKEAAVSPRITRNIKYVDDKMVNENGVFARTIITKHDITVLGDIEVQGDITSHKDIKIDSNAVVNGNIFAEGNIFIGNNATILGVVFTQENIYVDDGVVIGQLGKIKSVVARGNIEFGRNCKVYGYISAEGIGEICPEY